MLQLTSVTKAFGGRVLFEDVTWRVNPGDRWGLVGPNGAGKTTLLRIICGEEAADGGDVASPKGWRIGYLAQETRREGAGSVLEETVAAIPEAGAVERKMRRLEDAMATASTQAEAEALAAEYAHAQDRFLAVDGYSVEGRAREILAGLGFAERDLVRPIAELSGGFGMRVHLAGLLLASPDLLLLDEPTNHLDLESLEWVEEFMADYKGAWVVVSHDRYFLNRMVSGIVDLRPDGADLYPGNYDAFLLAREEREAQRAREAEGQAKKVAELQAFVDRFRYKATKARQAQSRVKQIARIAKDLAPIAAPRPGSRRPVRIRLPKPERSGRATLTLRHIRKEYPTETGGVNRVYDGLDFQVERGDHVALVGPNGAGKSTLLKILAGATPIQGGERVLGHNVRTYHYGQHQSDELHPANTVLQEVRAVMAGAGETQVRGLLGAFLFSEDEVDKYVGVLSGGEKARVALAKMLAKPANVLLLDEPTNHLDLESRQVLEDALADFEGTLVFVSHDRYFINRVATKVVEVQPRRAPVVYPGNYDYWQWKRRQPAADKAPEAAPPPAAAAAPAPAPPVRPPPSKSKAAPAPSTPRAAPAPTPAPAPRPAAPGISKNARRRMEQEVAALEADIAHLEDQIARIDAALADPRLYADREAFDALLKERNELQPRLDRKMARWEERSAELDATAGSA